MHSVAWLVIGRRLVSGGRQARRARTWLPLQSSHPRSRLQPGLTADG
jgi:hypothetical protein